MNPVGVSPAASTSRSADAAHRGLSSEEAARRRAVFGPNEIQRAAAERAWVLLARQFNSPVIWLLVAGCSASAALGHLAEATAIVAIVLLNGAIGFFQERRAEHAIQALQSMTAPRARVRRDGRLAMMPAADLVPGDVVLLEPGDVVPADARVIEAHALSTNEAALTGESVPVRKSADRDAPGARLAERHNSVFMGTAVATGAGGVEVVATGMQTELGRIAHLLAAATDTVTPLQRQLASVGRVLVSICLVIVAVVTFAGVSHGTGLVDLLLSSVSLAVAAVPEGLPAIVTIALAVGVQRMSARHVLVRRLTAVEALGCATVICTDKTGTLTTGIMTVREVWGSDERRTLKAAAACCDAEIVGDGPLGTGDPTEIAILSAAAPHDIRREAIESSDARVRVHPFDPARKWMAVERASGVYVKGAVEVIVPRCVSGTEGALDANARMAARSLRVLAVASGAEDPLDRLHLHGLVAIADPPRPEAVASIAAARGAGIRTVMITGDHPVTARAIAEELGILQTGEPDRDAVYARATPEDKLRIVRDWKARGAIVAMTGDGVNDAPALREAHIGIAMGRTGTDVTREASDMVLADDNFASIIAAVKEGRGVYDNIRKTLVYLLAGNTSELVLMLAAALAGLPLPLGPLQLLWINIVTDGLPALALVMDPTPDDVLRRPPRVPGERMLGAAEWNAIVAVGAFEAGVVLAVFAWALGHGTLIEARSLAFSTLVMAELFRAFAARSSVRIFWTVGAFTNLRLLLVVAVSAVAQVALHHSAATQAFFGLAPLTLTQWTIAALAGLCPVTAIEVWKMLRPFVTDPRTPGPR